MVLLERTVKVRLSLVAIWLYLAPLKDDKSSGVARVGSGKGRSLALEELSACFFESGTLLPSDLTGVSSCCFLRAVSPVIIFVVLCGLSGNFGVPVLLNTITSMTMSIVTPITEPISTFLV